MIGVADTSVLFYPIFFLVEQPTTHVAMPSEVTKNADSAMAIFPD